MKSLLLGLILAMSAVLPAAAENWVYIGSSKSGTRSHVDTESITDINGGYAYTEMMINETKNKYLVVRKEMLCADRAIKINAYEAYTRSGQLIESRKTPGDMFENIVIDTVTATLWQKLCN